MDLRYALHRLLTHDVASDEWVARVTLGARADGIVVDDHASRLDAARAGTRISAFLIGASFILPAV
jgi:hypothetical protein